MKILQINKFSYIEGGTERYYIELSKLLKKHGHEIAYFSMNDPRNFATKWSKCFVGNISFGKVNYKNGFNIVKRMIYSLEAKEKINKLLDEFHPDIVHIHNIYNHISPSILPEIKKRNIPIIQTVHDYHMLAPNKNLFHSESVCEISKRTSYYKSILHKCVKNSFWATCISVTTLYIHKIIGLYSKYIDCYVSPSRFAKNLLIEYGYDKKNVKVIPYFTVLRNNKSSGKQRRYLLYFGRLSPEKGLLFLLNVMKEIPQVTLYIAGEGPELSKIQNSITHNALRNVRVLGYLKNRPIQNIISGSYFTILPSLWYENYPNSILESFAYGKPVVGSNIGGIPELIRNKRTGLLFQTNNITDCIQKILILWNNPKLVKQLGKNALNFVKENNNPEDHYNKIIGIYKTLI